MGRGHMDFAALFAAVNFREGYIMARTKGEYGESFYSFRQIDGQLWFCSGHYTGKGNKMKWKKAAMPSAHDRECKDWGLAQNEDGSLPNL